MQEVTAKDYADSLLQVEDLPELKDVKALHKALKRADETWVTSFRESDGITGIYKVCVCVFVRLCVHTSILRAFFRVDRASRLININIDISFSINVDQIRVRERRNRVRVDGDGDGDGVAALLPALPPFSP